MKIAVLGPKGSFSHQAGLKHNPHAEIVFRNTIWYVFEAVKNMEADIGIVPIENSLSGTISATLDALTDFDFNIIDELLLPIKHNLAGAGRIEQIKVVYAHPQTLSQCEKFIRKYLPDAEIIRTSSNSKSAEIIAKKHEKNKAAIVSQEAAEIYNLNIIKKNIQDSPYNVTRFVAVGADKAKMTGKDRTSISIYPQVDKPGLLYNLLGEFANNRINLTKIESRPSKGKLGDYLFFIDLEGHIDDENVREAIDTVRKVAIVKMLGSYPRAY
ncbi:MAG: prephenate dehydratase [Nanoarchaeota archaeon]|nr:prephenate dehydratase [Nanoarchaeota archaeon]MBU1704941.1 prephenate dehydratase [Nanoarchaeota archaeon]